MNPLPRPPVVPARSGTGHPARLADALVGLGAAVFLTGALALAAVLVAAATGRTAPTSAVSLALLCPGGFGLGLAGLVAQARHRRDS